MERQNVAGYVFKVDTAIHPRCFPYSKCALSRFRSWKMRRLFSMHICDKNKQSLVKVPSQTHFTNKPVSQEIIRTTQVFCMIWQQVGPNIPRCPGQQVLVTPHFILSPRDPDLTRLSCTAESRHRPLTRNIPTPRVRRPISTLYLCWSFLYYTYIQFSRFVFQL